MNDVYAYALALAIADDDKPTEAALRKLIASGAAQQMADAPAKSVTEGQAGAPASSEVALAGPDGRALARVMREAKAYGVRRVAKVYADAAGRYAGSRSGAPLTKDELNQIAETIAAVNGTAELFGRARVRELQDRATAPGETVDEPLAKFADGPSGTEIATPEQALAYFLGLYPSIGVDPERWPGEQRRRAFTLAATMDQNVTADVQKRIADALKGHSGTADATASLEEALNLAGVTGANPQYSEMLFRTNAMDSYQTGAYEEGAADGMDEYFPCWQYLGIRDGRQGSDHEPHFDKYYPRSAVFADVRGNRPYNCRCSLRWVDRFEWEKLTARGAKVES